MPTYQLNKSVSGVQFDIATSGTFYPLGSQEYDYVELSPNNYRVLVWVETETTFTEEFFYCSASSTFSNIIGSDFYGTEITGVTITLVGLEYQTQFIITRGLGNGTFSPGSTSLIVTHGFGFTQRRGRVSWAELQVPDASRRGRVSWAELQIPNVPRRGRVSWTEMQVPTAPRRGRVSWTEFQVPDVTRRAQVSWAELQVPTAPRRGRVSWAELETPITDTVHFIPTRGFGAGNLSAESVQYIITAGFISSERRARISWAELQIPDATRRGQVSWAVLQVPTAPRRGRVSWAELQVGTAPRRGRISWAELQAPDAPQRARVSWAELQVPSKARCLISWAEFEVGGTKLGGFLGRVLHWFRRR